MARHHYVPQFILRGFANEREQIKVVDRATLSRTYVSSVRKAAAQNDYYSIATELLEPGSREGHKPDLIEESLSFIEDKAAEQINIIRAGSWDPTYENIYPVARFVAFQLCRGPSFRRDYADIATSVAQRLVRSKITKDRIRAHLEENGRKPTDDEVDEFHREVRTANFKMVPPEVHTLQESMRLAIETYLPHLLERTPEILRFDTPELMTSDKGVGLWAPDAPHPRSVEVANARAVFLPLDRHTALSLTRRKSYTDRHLNKFWAQHINVAVCDRASSSLYHHPDDEPLKGVELPPPRRLVSVPTSGKVREDGALVVQNVEYWE